MSGLSRLVLALVALVFLTGGTAHAGRVALVIGNGDYAVAGTLANPVNDAEDIAAKFRSIGFTVVDGYNLGKRELEQKIGEFADALEGADAGLFYYAGHGIAVDGRSFIVPTDARLDIPAKLKLEALPIDDILELMEQQARTAIMILDACRNNPFARSLRGASTTRAVQAAEGLAQIEPARGSFIMFSAAPGSVALDGTGRNSPFAAALLKHLGEPGQSINDLMTAVRRDVVNETREFQNPMAWDSLTDRFEFVPGSSNGTAIGPASNATAIGPTSNATTTGPAELHATGGSDLYHTGADVSSEIESFVKTRYLRRTVEDMEAIYTDPITAGGRERSRAELIERQAAFFDKLSKLELDLVPGTLKVLVHDESSVTTTFDVRFKFTRKDTGEAPRAGIGQRTLYLVKEDSGWRIKKIEKIEKEEYPGTLY